MPEGESHIFQDALSSAIEKGETVKGVLVEGEWFETGNEKDFLKATGDLIDKTLKGDSDFLNELGGLYWPNAPETQKLDPSSAFSKRVLAGSHIEVQENVTIEGFCVLGNGVKVEKKSKLEDSVVLPGAVIPEGFEAKSQLLFSDMP